LAEGRGHREAVAWTKTILRLRGYHIYENDWSRGIGGYKFPTIMTDKDRREWTADIFAQTPSGRCFIIEIDGQEPGQGHSSRHNKIDDDFRDRTLQKFGIATVRLQTSWLVGDKPESDTQIMLEINHWLEKKLVCQH